MSAFKDEVNMIKQLMSQMATDMSEVSGRLRAPWGPSHPQLGGAPPPGNAGTAILPAGMRVLYPTSMPCTGDHDQVLQRPQLGNVCLPRGQTPSAPGRGTF